MENGNVDAKEIKLNTTNNPLIQNAIIEMDENGVMNLTTKSNQCVIYDQIMNPSSMVQAPALNNDMSSNFSCNDPIILQPIQNGAFVQYDIMAGQANNLQSQNFQFVPPSAYTTQTPFVQSHPGNVPKSDNPQYFVQSDDGYQYLHFMMNGGFTTADLTNSFVNLNNSAWQNYGFGNVTPSIMCVETPAKNVATNNMTVQKNIAISQFSNNFGAKTKCSETNSSVATEVGMEVVTVEDSEDDVIFMGEYEDLKGSKVGIVGKDLENKSRSILSNGGSMDDKMSLKNTKMHFTSALDISKVEKEKKLIPVRRNPKRKVQIEKKSLELAWKLSEIDDFKRPTNKRSTFEQVGSRRSARQLATIGSVRNNPKPLTEKDFKSWPVNGMHERPEYDLVNNLIYPFDYTIRNISETSRKRSPAKGRVCKSPATYSPKTFREEFENDSEASVLRHLIGYISQIKSIRKKKAAAVTSDKMVAENDEGNLEKDKNLKELLYNTCLLHCMTNSVKQNSLASYLLDFGPEIAIDWVNKMIKNETTS